MNRRILVTGGLGYLGGRICQALEAARWIVRITSRKQASSAPAWSKSYELMEMAELAPRMLVRACEGVDAVVHLAAMNEIDSAADPEGALRANGLESLVWLRAAEAAGVRRFVFFSTAHVYGAPLVGRLDETTLPRPRHPYAITHRVTEDFVLATHAAQRMDGLVVRLSNAVGAPADHQVNRWMLVANDLCREAMIHGTVTLKSSGLQQRDFIAMSDVAAAVIHFAEAPREMWADGLFNLGSGQSMTVFDLANLIAQRAGVMLGRTVPVTRTEPEPGESAAALDFCVDKLKATGFSPIGALTDEIDATLSLCGNAFGTNS